MWWTNLVACVVAIDQHVVVDEPVDRIEVVLANGDITVTAGAGPVTLDGAIAGPSDGSPFPEVVDGVLRVVVDCAACGGSLAIRAPADTELELDARAGSISVEGMASAVTATVELGNLEVRAHGAGRVALGARFGDVSLDRSAADDVYVDVDQGSATVDVPAGPWALELDVRGGSLALGPGIVDDPTGPALEAQVNLGSLRVR
jgi:hypothetical protein